VASAKLDEREDESETSLETTKAFSVAQPAVHCVCSLWTSHLFSVRRELAIIAASQFPFLTTTASYAAYSRYFRAVSRIFTLETTEYAGNRYVVVCGMGFSLDFRMYSPTKDLSLEIDS
jgi:hypothetical protein